MDCYDVYKSNLDFNDKYGLQGVRINKQAIFRGDLKNIMKLKDVEKDDIERPLAAAVIGLNNTGAPFPVDTRFYNAWTDIDAQEIFLDSKPTCYLILGKPGSGSYRLGEALAKKTNCIHLCPRTIITDEIEQESTTGKCLELNMRMNKVCAYSTILKLLRVKIESIPIQHRGYVISGFPLVNANRNEKYLVQSLYGEESVEVVDPLLFDIICNLKKKPKKNKEEVVSPSTRSSTFGDLEHKEEQEEEAEEEEEQQLEEVLEEEEQEIKVETPKFLLKKCNNLIFPEKPYYVTQREALLEQLNFIFSLKMTPDVIIYISTHDKDLVTKKYNKLYNNKSNNYLADPFITSMYSELRWPPKFTTTGEESRIDFVFDSKYCCRHPMNFKNNSTQQMCNYRNNVYPFIEAKLNDYDPAHIIKVDGRQTINEMMHNVLERLIQLNIKPVIIPMPISLDEPSEDLEEFWKSVEEMNPIEDGVLNFKRYVSLWCNRCPVELKKGRSVIGKPKLAVTFFKHVFLLSSLNNLIDFYWNPRPFLKLKYLEPTCRIIVIGTKSSGKTMVSECLAWLFDIKPIHYEKIVESEKEKKFKSYAKTVLHEILPHIDDARLTKWRSNEMEREALLNQWCSMIMAKIQQFIPLLIAYLKYLSRTEAAGEETQEEEETKSEQFDEDLLEKIEHYKKDLAFLPYLDDPQNYAKALDRKIIAEFAPPEFKTPTPKPAVPVIDDSDVRKAVMEYIETNDQKSAIEPTIDELMHETVRVLTQIDNQQKINSNYERHYGKYIIDGFPSDPDCWGHLVDAKLLPDYIIALIENRDIDKDLFNLYKEIDTVPKSYKERFTSVNDPLVKTKLVSHNQSQDTMEDIDLIINQIITKTDIVLHSEEYNPEMLTAFSGAIEKFKVDLDTLKLKFEEHHKCLIDVEIETKTDIQILEEVLLKLRQGYFITPEVNEEDDAGQDEEEEKAEIDLLKFNDPIKYCDTYVYCPIAYYEHGVLWDGKPEFTIKHNNRLHLFSSEECLQMFQQNVHKYQSYNRPFKSIPPLRICIIGPIGSGRTTISKLLAKELGLVHIDFPDVINKELLPQHFKKVGREYENSFTDVPLDDEAVVDFQMSEENETLMTDILSNETEMRRMVYNYFERGSPIISILMQKLIKKFWFQDPFINKGFILDGYPRLPSDVEDMISCYCIPDLVIELECSSEVMLKHLSNKMFKIWKLQLAEAKEKARQKLDKERQQWMNNITKHIVAKVIVNEIVENVLVSQPELIQALKGSTESVVADTYTTITSNVDTNLMTAYNEIIIENPEPVDLTEWPKAEEARENIDARLESNFETDDENIQSLKEVLSEQKIKTMSIDVKKPLNKIMRVILLKITNLRNRNQSLFEQTFIISTRTAEILLNQGFMFLSQFNHTCPVYMYENPNTIQSNYNSSKKEGNIFTIIHRNYAYYVSGKENVIKFRTDPLKYVTCRNVCSFVEYPLKIAIIGPPKSGKSTLSAKLATRFDLLYTTRGKALRHVVHKMHWTELASKIEKSIRSGECVEARDIMKAVQSIVFDHRTVRNGYVLDGFPETAVEAMELSQYGLYPSIIIDLKSDVDKIAKISQQEIYYNILKYMPPYSEPFIRNRYTKWSEANYNIRNWIKDDYQNLYELNGHDSKWQCLQSVLDVINDYIPQVHHYLINVNNKVVPAGVMCISNEVFDQRASEYKKLCPVCFNRNILRHGDYPVDKKGVVQYNNTFYWICPDHLGQVLKYAHYLLKPAKIQIPELPAVVKNVHLDLVYENGICIVTYAENLPSQKIIQGSNNFSASFKGKIYMMCSEKCLQCFLAKPHMYADITVFSELKLLPPLCLHKMPDVGYLEQTVGNLLVQACCAVNVHRPKYPGLSMATSALLYIALYMKSHKPGVEKNILERFAKVTRIYEARSKIIRRVGLIMRSMDNPFAKYPKCCKHVSVTVVKQPSATSSAKPSISLTSRVPVPDERYDYLCEFHKPASKVPAFLNVVDIAGLVRGAAEGQGLGNAFLSHIKACDAIFNLCRAFDDEDVIHVDGDVNPVRDLETIGEELRLKDEEQLMANFEKLDRVVNRGGDKKLKPEYDSLLRIKAILVDEKKHIRFGDWSAADIEVINKYLFLTSKPALYLVNLSEKDYIRKKNKWLPKLKEWIDKNDPGAPLIPFSGVLETKLFDMDSQEKQAFLKEHNITSALDKIIVQGYKALQLEYFFTAGPDEVKAWTIQKGTKAPQAAGRIHTDFEKGFIMAEVMHFKDFKEEGTEAACKAAGKYRQQGRNYVVEDGDIIFFKFNAGAGLKDAKKK